MDVPWLIVAGFGAHIKSTRNTLVVHRNGSTEEYPIRSIRHLMLIGGHTIQTTLISHLVGAGSTVSFFEADGKPIGTIRPFNDNKRAELALIQKSAPGHPYAVAIAKASMQSKTLMIGKMGELVKKDLFYEGEIQIFTKALEELDFLIKMSEIRRIHRLSSDMYYEVLSRVVPPEFEFRRRTERPYHDPVNATLAFGYAMLFGNTLLSITGADLDPEIGTLNRGPFALVHDIMEPLKAEMIDQEAVRFIRDDLKEGDYECGPTRCILSDACIKELIRIFHRTIDQKVIDNHVAGYLGSLVGDTDYVI